MADDGSTASALANLSDRQRRQAMDRFADPDRHAGHGEGLSRYPQLYSQIGFAHHYRPLQGDELTFVLTRLR